MGWHMSGGHDMCIMSGAGTVDAENIKKGNTKNNNNNHISR